MLVLQKTTRVQRILPRVTALENYAGDLRDALSRSWYHGPIYLSLSPDQMTEFFQHIGKGIDVIDKVAQELRDSLSSADYRK